MILLESGCSTSDQSPRFLPARFIDGARTLKYVRSGRLDGGSAPFGPKYFMTNGDAGQSTWTRSSRKQCRAFNCLRSLLLFAAC